MHAGGGDCLAGGDRKRGVEVRAGRLRVEHVGSSGAGLHRGEEGLGVRAEVPAVGARADLRAVRDPHHIF
jgi:hypothetical protein